MQASKGNPLGFTALGACISDAATMQGLRLIARSGQRPRMRRAVACRIKVYTSAAALPRAVQGALHCRLTNAHRRPLTVSRTQGCYGLANPTLGD